MSQRGKQKDRPTFLDFPLDTEANYKRKKQKHIIDRNNTNTALSIGELC